MMSFKEYLIHEAIDTKTGNYVSVKTSFPDDMQLIEPETGSVSKDPHVTLMYSKEQSEDPKDILERLQSDFKKSGVCRILRASSFDSIEDGESKQCIVLELDSPAMHRIHYYLQNLGLKHSYDSYQPHLTLFYDVDTDEAKHWVNWINNTSNLPGQLLEFSGFESTFIIKDWQK